MSETTPDTSPQDAVPHPSESEIVAARRAKLRRFRDELGFEPYGQRVDGLQPLADARSRFSEEAHLAFDAAAKEAKSTGGVPADARAVVRIAGRVVQHRDRPDPRLYLGKGRLEELSEWVKENDSKRSLGLDGVLGGWKQRAFMFMCIKMQNLIK